jgi:hypothetical protein
MRTRFSSSEPMMARFGIEYASPELQEKSATPTESEQVIEPDSGVYGLSKVTVGAIDSDYVGADVPRRSSSDLTANPANKIIVPAGYYENDAYKYVVGGSASTPVTTIQANPTISVDTNGLITAEVGKQQSVTPTVDPGYVSSGIPGMITVTGAKHVSLDTEEAKTITPSENQQTAVTAGKYTKGAIIVNPIPSEYVIPTGTKNISANGTVDVSGFANADVAVPWNPLGEDAELIKTYDMGETKLSDTSFNGWTPSTTAKTIKSSGTLGTISSSALDTYEYVIYSVFDATLAYASGTTLKGAPVRQVIALMQHIHRKPSNLTNLASATDNQNYCVTFFTASLMDYYSTGGTHTLAWTGSYGLYPAAGAATFSSSTNASPTITVKSPAFTARCSTTYFTTTMAAAVDQTNSKIKCKVYVYRIKKNFTAYKMFHDLVTAHNA